MSEHTEAPGRGGRVREEGCGMDMRHGDKGEVGRQ